MRHFFPLCICTALLAASCAPSSRVLSSTAAHPPLPEDAYVAVLNVDQSAPKEGTLVGELKIGDSGFTTNCDYQTVVAKAKKQAREMGGNLVKITTHKRPDMMSTCHRIWAEVFYLDSVEELDIPQAGEVAVDEALLAENCAILYFYRPRNFQGGFISYNVKLGDETVWRASNNKKEWIKVQAIGATVISAKTESERTLPIDIQPGLRYYIRCGVGMGVMVGRPSLELVDEVTGKYEFDSIQN